ncbi:unnamed protein product [Rotaria sp. Silwood1]|nr:unnamed protein product [Rotaria sp. Silwood1]
MLVMESTALLLIGVIACFSINVSFDLPSANENIDNVVSLNIENANIGQIILPTMHGAILETNINRDDDGGIYAELIYNRAFQGSISLDGWSLFWQGSIAASTIVPLSSALPVQLRYALITNSTLTSDFRNSGFYGMNIQARNYTARFFYRPLSGAYVASGKLNIGFSNSSGQIIYGMSAIDVFKTLIDIGFYFSFTIPVYSSAPITQNFFFIEFPPGSKGDFEFNLISCFSPTYKNRPNGARIDIAQAFADLKPGYVRLPGGRRGTWTGYDTKGFGLIELLTFVVDIGATPVLAVYVEYSLDRKAVPPDQLQPYIDEVIKELDFLTASASNNRMGALRVRLDRSQPFDIKYVGIGNEDWIDPASSSYNHRWSAFYNALSQK